MISNDQYSEIQLLKNTPFNALKALFLHELLGWLLNSWISKELYSTIWKQMEQQLTGSSCLFHQESRLQS